MRKLFLILCIAFVVVCYGYPCLVLPFGTYKYEEKIGGTTVEYSYKFHFNGTVDVDLMGLKEEYYYKLKGNKLILSVDKKFDETEDDSIEISSIYKIGEAVNQIGMYTAIGIGVAALVLVITYPRRKD